MLSMHFDIERHDSHKPYGYRWTERAKGMLIPTITEQESLLLSLSESYLRNSLPSTLINFIEGFFIQARLDSGTHENHERKTGWLEKILVIDPTPSFLPPSIRDGVFEGVSNALYANRWLTVDYENITGNHSTQSIMPLALVLKQPKLFLVGRFQHNDNETALALHRMKSAKESAITFERPKDFNLHTYNNDWPFGFIEEKRIK